MRLTSVFLFILICFTATSSFAQETKVKKPFRVWLKSQSGNQTPGLHGPAYLVELKDSSLVLAHLVDIKNHTFLTKEYPIQDMGMLKFRKEKIVGRSVLVSALTGFALGGIVGVIDGGGDIIGPETTTQAVFCYGSILGVLAAMYVGPAFSLKTKVVLKGDQSTYEKKKETLRKFQVDLSMLTDAKYSNSH